MRETGQKTRRPAMNTYYRSQDKSPDSPFIKKAPKKPVRKFLFGFLDMIILSALLLGLAYSLTLSANPKIIANDYSFHSKSIYARSAQKLFEQFKNRNKITFNENQLVSSMQSQFPELSSVQVELPFLSEQPVLRLVVAEPSFAIHSGSATYIVDSDGVAVARPAGKGIKGLPLVEDKSGFELKAGSHILSSDSVGFINSVIAQCRRAKVPIASLNLPPIAQELQLRTKDQAYYVKFYLGGDALLETGQFLAARQHFTQAHSSPAQYLDVRIPGKIFYK